MTSYLKHKANSKSGCLLLENKNQKTWNYKGIQPRNNLEFSGNFAGHHFPKFIHDYSQEVFQKSFRHCSMKSVTNFLENFSINLTSAFLLSSSKFPNLHGYFITLFKVPHQQLLQFLLRTFIDIFFRNFIELSRKFQ